MSEDASKQPIRTTVVDVYRLVQDGNDRMERKIDGVGGKMDNLAGRFETHLIEHASARGVREGEARIKGIARSSLALMISIPSALLALLTLATR